jgi:cytochrome c oxidase subunit 2
VGSSVLANSDGYIPEVIKVPAGRAVTLHIKSLDVLHGFVIPDINVQVDLRPGASTVVALPALKPAKYQFLCDIFLWYRTWRHEWVYPRFR